MKHYVGLDGSLETTAICVIDDQGQVITSTSAASDPQAIATVLRQQPGDVVRIVLESGQLSTWLTRELRALGLPVVCPLSRHVGRGRGAHLALDQHRQRLHAGQHPPGTST